MSGADYMYDDQGRTGGLVLGSGVFWPGVDDPLSRLTGVFPFPTSDHRLVWLDIKR